MQQRTTLPFHTPTLVKYFFMALPLLEIAGFIYVGSLLGIFMTLLLIIFTTVLGAAVLRHAGMLALWRWQSQINAEASQREATAMTLQMMAGVLLLIPGFITDIFGLLLLIPAIRDKITGHLSQAQYVNKSHQSERVIEGEYTRKDNYKD